MKHARFFSLGLLFAVGCSSSNVGQTPDAASAADAGAGADAASTAIDAEVPADAAPPDAIAPDARSYEEAARASAWAELTNAPKVTMGKQDDIFFTSPSRGFAVSGPAEKIYKTEDSGESWSTVKTSRGTYFRSVLFVDDQHGFASNLGPIPRSGITDTNLLYETIDGGGTWNPVTMISGPRPTGICNQTKIDAQHIVAVGRVTGPSYLMSTRDGGATWTSIDLNSKLQMLIDARFTSATEGIVVGGTAANPLKCTILRTTDGMNFDTVFTSSAANTLCWKISFPSDQVGYVSIQYVDPAATMSTIAKTTDGGRTWVERPLVAGSYAAIGVGFITEEVGWIASDDPAQLAYRTIDGGDTWTVDPNLKSPVNRFRFVDRQTAYAIGGTVYKLAIDWDAP
jgi:photosystem II stability/assembly factor-like uncharacterized protein